MPPQPTEPVVATSPDANAGVIHDIGYRHYDGERLGRRAIRWALYLESFKAAYGFGRTARAKIMPMLLLAAMSLPALIIVVITAVTGQQELVAGYVPFIISLQLVVAIYVAGQAPASVSRDLRFRTTSLYLSRPLERSDYLVARYAALASAVFVLVALPLTIMFVGSLLARLSLSAQLPDYLRAMAGAALLAGLLAGIGLVIAAITPRRGLGVAAIITVLLVVAGVQGTAQGIAFDLGADRAAEWFAALSPFTLVAGIQSSLLGAAGTGMYVEPTDPVIGVAFLALALAGVAACYGLLTLRFRRVNVS